MNKKNRGGGAAAAGGGMDRGKGGGSQARCEKRGFEYKFHGHLCDFTKSLQSDPTGNLLLPCHTLFDHLVLTLAHLDGKKIFVPPEPL